MKKILALFLALVMTLALLPTAVFAKQVSFYQDEDDENLYHIANLDGLEEFRTQAGSLANKTVILENDIDLGDEEWTPINGSHITFEGNNKTISNLKVTGDAEYAGLFGDFSCSSISDLTIDGADVSGSHFVAALCGSGLCTEIENCTVENADVTVSVKDNDNGDKAGAICGYLSGEPGAFVKDCTVTGCTVTGYRDCGGAVGMANGTAEVSGNTVSNTTIYNDRLINYKNYTTDAEFNIGEVVGRKSDNAVISNNTYSEQVVIEVINPIAKIGTIGYKTLADAVSAAKKGETVALCGDIDFGDFSTSVSNIVTALSVAADKEFTLDLCGHQISGNTSSGSTSALIYNKGKLTVKDSVGGGRIFSGATPTWKYNDDYNYAGSYASNTIRNEGALTVLSGTIENAATGYACYAVDNYNSASLTVKGGILRTSFAAAIRMFYGDGALSISGSPEIRSKERFAVQVMGGTNAVTISGGSFYGGQYALATYQAPNASFSVSDGFFYAPIGVECNTSFTGGTYYGYDPADVDGVNYVADGYISTDAGNDTYVIIKATNKTNNLVQDALDKTEIAEQAEEEEKAAAEATAKDAVEEAVKAVDAMDNATLAENSKTMENLESLEEIFVNQVNSDDSKGAITVTTTNNSSVSDTVSVNVGLSADVDATATKDQKLELKVEDKTVDAQAAVTLDAIKAAAKGKVEDEIGADKVSQTIEPIPLDITLIKTTTDKGTQDNKVEETVSTPSAPVIMTFALPSGWSNCRVVNVDDNGIASDEEIPTTITGSTVTAVLKHFSTYVLVPTSATLNGNEYEIILTADKTNLSAGDTVTYTVSLKHLAGDAASVGYFRYAPAPANADLLEYQSATAETGVTYNKIGGSGDNYEFVLSSATALAVGASKTIGTLTYKVKAYAVDDTEVEVTNLDSEETSVTNPSYADVAALKISQDKTVTYHAHTVTFQYGDGTEEVFYTRYDQSGLYASLDDAYAGTTADAPTLSDNAKGNGSVTNGTQYRLLDTDWHVTTASGDAYADTNKFKANATYVVNRVELLAITIPDSVTVTSTVTERSSVSYVDKGADLTFTVSAPTLGNKQDISVTAAGNAVTVSPDSVTDATTEATVAGTEMSAGPVVISISESVDFDASDIRIFTTGEDATLAYLEYSKYGSSDTLVLLKGKEGAHYTLGAGQPAIFAIPDSVYGDGYTHAVLVPKQETVSESAMLAYLVSIGLIATDTENTAISYDWNTNGLDGSKLADVQATHDFQSLTATDFKWTPTDALLLKADVANLKDAGDVYKAADYTVARNGYVSIEDINTFMYEYARLAK